MANNATELFGTSLKDYLKKNGILKGSNGSIDDIIAELKKRYSDKKPPETFVELVRENKDLIDMTFQVSVRKKYGEKSRDFFLKEGILSAKETKVEANNIFSSEDFELYLTKMKERYGNAEVCPCRISELEEQNPDIPIKKMNKYIRENIENKAENFYKRNHIFKAEDWELEEYIYCSIAIDGKEWNYIAKPEDEVKVGDLVVIDFGWGGECVKEISKVIKCLGMDAPYPVSKTKYIIRNTKVNVKETDPKHICYKNGTPVKTESKPIEELFEITDYDPENHKNYFDEENNFYIENVNKKFCNPVFRGLENEIDAAIEYLYKKGMKERKCATDIEGVFEIQPGHAKEVLETFPNLKMIAFFYDFKMWDVKAVYSASGYPFVTSSKFIGGFDPKADWQWFYDCYPDIKHYRESFDYIQTGERETVVYNFPFEEEWNTVDYVFEKDGKKQVAFKEYIPPEPTLINLEFFRKIIFEEFNEFKIEENVPLEKFAPDFKKPCAKATFVLYKNDDIKAVVRVTNGLFEKMEEYRNVKKACKAAGIPYVEFYECSDDIKNKVIKDIAYAVFAKKFEEYVVNGKESDKWVKASERPGYYYRNVKVKFADNRSYVYRGYGYLKIGDIVKVDGKKAGQPGMIIEADVDEYYGNLKNVTEYMDFVIDLADSGDEEAQELLEDYESRRQELLENYKNKLYDEDNEDSEDDFVDNSPKVDSKGRISPSKIKTAPEVKDTIQKIGQCTKKPLIKGKIFVLTEIFYYDIMENYILQNGGEIKSTTVLATDYIIIGDNSSGNTNKVKRAIELNQAKGKSIKALSENDFWFMMSDEYKGPSENSEKNEKQIIKKREEKLLLEEKRQEERLLENKHREEEKRIREEKARKAEKERRKEEERRRLEREEHERKLQEEARTFVKRIREHKEWEAAFAEAQEKREAWKEKMISKKSEELEKELEQKRDSEVSKSQKRIDGYEKQIRTLKNELEHLGFFAFGEKSEKKKEINTLERNITDENKKIAEAKEKFEAAKKMIPANVGKYAKNIDLDKSGTLLPKEPKVPRLSSEALSEAAYAFLCLNKGTYFTVPEIAENLGIENSFLFSDNLRRLYISGKIRRVEERRKVYYIVE